MRIFLAAALALASAPLAAQAVFGPPDPAKAVPAAAVEPCPPPTPNGEIVVCAELEDQEQFRVEPTRTDGTEGAPRAPNLESDFNHSGMGVIIKGCFIPPCPPPMPTIIDLKAIPEAPPGSDADRAGRGLAPSRGNGNQVLSEDPD